MSTSLKEHHEAAAKARRLAEEAASMAAAAEREAEQAVAKAREAADDRLRRDAERTIATFDQDLAELDASMIAARDAFSQHAATAESFVELRDRYFAWSDLAADLYWLHRSLANALGRLGKSTYQGRAVPSFSDRQSPPAFSAALDQAMARVISARNADIEDAAVQRILDLEAGEVDDGA
jgi:predicted lipoprotein with Yx(FWY)xxD motif